MDGIGADETGVVWAGVAGFDEPAIKGKTVGPTTATAGEVAGVTVGREVDGWRKIGGDGPVVSEVENGAAVGT